MARLFLRVSCAILSLLPLLASAAGVRTPEGIFDGPAVTLPGHVAPIPAEAATLKARAAAGDLRLTVVLNRFDQPGFDRFLQDLYDPASADFRKYLSPREVSDRFGPSEDDYAVVKAWFSAQGFAIRDEAANRMTLGIEGSRAVVEKSLRADLRDYNLGRKTVRANAADPQVPAAVAQRVHAIIGLSTVAEPRPQTKAIGNFGCWALYSFLLANNAANDFGTWYSACASWLEDYKGGGGGGGGGSKAASAAVPWRSATGAGQTIGIVAFDNYSAGDLADTIALYELPANRINQVSQVHVGGGATPGANQAEVLLDVILPLLVAPAASIVVHDAPLNASFQSVFNSLINGGVSIISNSWSYCEDQTTTADVQSIESLLQTAAASGISVLNASGDTGSTCLDGSANTTGVPASAPHSTAVGGTTLEPGPGQLVYGSEKWWGANAQAQPTGAGGFGTSRFFSRPSYQNGLVASTMRSIPDIALAADPARSGVPLCIATQGGCPNGLLYGGTSMSAPAMAGFVALLNHSLGTNLGFLNAALYPLSGTASFHTPASMGSDFAHVGLGSPNLSMMHAALAGMAIGPVSQPDSRVYANPQTPAKAYADGVDAAFIGIELRDANGHPVAGKTVSLTPSIVGHVTIMPATAITDSSGGAVFTLTNLTAESVSFTANDVTDGITLNGTPVVDFIVPPAASAGIAASPTTVSNNGIATTTITVTLKDALNRPTPGKQISLSQGNGHSIITSPTPAVTNASGIIQFTATNRFAETVTYTAIDVTDGNLPVPGNAVVQFSGQANSSCSASAPPLAAGPGYAITTFATGFQTAAFNYSNVNYSCTGVQNPAFDTAGNAYLADFPNGKLYKFTLTGGAATDGNVVFGQGPTLQQPVFSKTGTMYVVRSTTGAGFTSGVVLEVNPATGGVIRTLASNLTCPTNPALDPISGDIFFTDACFGAGADNPALFRILGTAGATPTLTTYATLPATPNGSVTFSPDGTMYVAVGYNSVKSVVRVTATSAPQPPTLTTLSGINTFYLLQVAETLPDGSARSLLVFDNVNSVVRLVDITQNPPTSSTIATGPVSTGTIGPDGCLYMGANETAYRVTTTSGACGFAPSNQAPTLMLSPASAASAQGGAAVLTATFRNTVVAAGTPVRFVIDGPNIRVLIAKTDANGVATISYTGALTGTDNITASGGTLMSNQATLNWTSGAHATSLDLNSSVAGGSAGTSTVLTANLFDLSQPTPTPIAGKPVHFAIGSSSCDAVTTAAGVASCSVALTAPGAFTLIATFAGDAQYQPASAAMTFLVRQPNRIDIDGNGHYDALTDGLMLIRWMFGLTGTNVVVGAIGPGATRTQASDIVAYLAALQPLLDVDADGRVDASTDGMMILRHMFGLRGAAVTANALGPNAGRSLASDIDAYIQSLMPAVQ